MFKAVLFDMDGVIINTEPVYLEVEMKLASELGIPLTEDIQKRYTGVHHSMMWNDLKIAHDFSMTSDEITEIESRLVNSYYLHGNLEPIEPTIELIKKLYTEGIYIAIATSNDDCNANSVVERLGIKQFISTVVTNSNVKNCKPAPDIFLLAADLLGLEPKDCVVVEDSKSGCLAAKTAGMKVVAYQNPHSGNQDLSAANIVIHDMGELTLQMLLILFGMQMSK